MYKVNQLGLIAASIITLAACGGSSNNSSNSDPQGDVEVTYQLTFNAKWNGIDFPTNFPSNPHFSPVIGATHNDQDYLWRSGEASTPGIEDVAETGSTTIYNTELEQKKTDGNIENIFKGSRIDSPSNTSLQFKVNTSFPYVSAISMIAPSPDWFIGIRDVNLYADNEWVDRLEFDLKLYDAGTDTAETFSAADADGGTGIISLVSTDAANTDLDQGVHRNSGKFVGTIVLQRVATSSIGTSEE
jgi:hypothetical protein